MERLEVHGKVYEPLPVVAEGTSYSEAELTQLVETKQVPAAMIDNQWFVDRAATVKLSQTIPSEAAKRRNATSKVNRASAIKAVYATTPDEPPPHPLTTTLQASAVVACGLLVGTLLYWSDQAGIDVLALEAGVIGAADAFAGGLEPMWETWESVIKSAWYAK